MAWYQSMPGWLPLFVNRRFLDSQLPEYSPLATEFSYLVAYMVSFQPKFPI